MASNGRSHSRGTVLPAQHVALADGRIGRARQAVRSSSRWDRDMHLPDVLLRGRVAACGVWRVGDGFGQFHYV
jgi:hypothetical protein